MERAMRLDGDRGRTTALAVAGAAALACAGFALSGSSRPWPALAAFALAALVGIARTTTA